MACKSSSEGTFWTKRLSATIVACSVLMVNVLGGCTYSIYETVDAVLLTCVAYLLTFNIDTMWTWVLHWDVCVAMSWLILVLMLWISLVVAVPVNQLRASPRKGSRHHLLCVLVCRWLEFSRFMAEVIVVLLDLYMSCMLDNSSWSVVSSCAGADGCWSKDWRNCCVLVSCLLKSFQWCSKFYYLSPVQPTWVP